MTQNLRSSKHRNRSLYTITWIGIVLQFCVPMHISHHSGADLHKDRRSLYLILFISIYLPLRLAWVRISAEALLITLHTYSGALHWLANVIARYTASASAYGCHGYQNKVGDNERTFEFWLKRRRTTKRKNNWKPE